MNSIVTILYVLLLVGLIIFLDLKYLKYDFKKRLIVNILIFLVFAAFYMLFLNNL